jgi:hypothetical protein
MVLGWGVQPSEWKALTLGEQTAYINHAKHLNSQANRRR